MRKCKVCPKKFTPVYSSIQRTCSPACAIIDARSGKLKKEIAKQDRAETRRRKDALLTRNDYIKRARHAFNAFIRCRDKAMPCVSCGTMKPGGDPRGGLWDCGHFRSVGAAPELRFTELNAHKQCKKCNRALSGHISGYRVQLLKRIGPERLAWIEGPHPPANWTIHDLKEIAKTYRKKLKEIKDADYIKSRALSDDIYPGLPEQIQEDADLDRNGDGNDGSNSEEHRTLADGTHQQGLFDGGGAN